jgi:soluble lytic murein transglycosylase-like protein
MRRTLSVLLALVSAVSWPQNPETYLKRRAEWAIERPFHLENIRSFSGLRFIEVRGVIAGDVSTGESRRVLIQQDAHSASVTLAEPLAWVSPGPRILRLLVRAERASATAPVILTAVDAAFEEDIAYRVQRSPVSQRRPSPVAAPTPTPARAGSRSTSRSKPRNWTLPASQVTPIYASYIRRVNPRLPTREAMKIAQGVVGFSLRYGVDARLVMAILMTESTFDPNEVSHAGARGLGQLMPDTARELGVRNVHDPAENIYGSVKLMRQHLDRYYRQTRGDGFQALVLSLAAYNAGPGAVRRHGGVPPYRETQRYIQKVQRYYRAFRGD